MFSHEPRVPPLTRVVQRQHAVRHVWPGRKSRDDAAGTTEGDVQALVELTTLHFTVGGRIVEWPDRANTMPGLLWDTCCRRL